MTIASKGMMHLVILPCAGFSHMRFFVELSKRLPLPERARITFITSPWMMESPSSHAILDTLKSIADSANIHFHHLPNVEFTPEQHAQHPDMHYYTKIYLRVQNSIPLLKEALASMMSSPHPPSAYLTDYFCHTTLETAISFGIPTYVRLPQAYGASLWYVTQAIMSSIVSSFHDDPDMEVEIPGLDFPIRVKDLPPVHFSVGKHIFDIFWECAGNLAKVDGILVNSFNDLETKALSSIVNVYPPIYCVGPLVSDNEASHKLECTEWLDKQPPGSVLFVSFGSSGSVPKLTLLEMAKGLEKSGHKFIWVVRNTQDGDAFSLDDVSVSGEQGMIIADWAPQQAILSHPSTGGFLSHCGWNSVSESIHMGVPIIPFPLLGDQRFNRILVLEEFRVGVDMKLEEGDAGELLVKAENVEKAVKELMEGEQGRLARERVKELSVLAHRALEGGGSSVCALSKLVSLWSPPMEHPALSHD